MSNLILDLNSTVAGVQAEDKGTARVKVTDGDYDIVLVKVEDWKEKVVKNMNVIQFDDNLQAIKGDDGKNLTVPMTDVKTYSTKVTLRIQGGEFDGTEITEYLTTHPNAPYTLRNFIASFKLDDFPLSQFPDLGPLGLEGFAYIKNIDEEYTKTTTDKYGRPSEEKKIANKNVIGRFKVKE